MTNAASTDTRASDASLPLKDPGVSPQDGPAPRARSTMPARALFLIVPLCLMLGGVVGLYFQPPGLRAFFSATGLEPGGGTSTPIAVAIEKVATREAVSLVSEGDVVALGRLLPRGKVVTVATPYGAGDARIDRLPVAVGDWVGRGDLIAVLDNLAQFEAALGIAQANVAVREAALAQARTVTRASLDEARASLERAEATADAALADLDRVTSMLQRGVTTRANFDEVQRRASEAIRDVERTRATLSRFTTDDDGLQADIAVAEANLASARAEEARAEAEIERSYVRAPIDGQVLQVHVRPGERPGTAGVVNIGDTSRMTAELEVFQTMIRRVSPGDRVTMSAPALSSELTGQVVAIGLEIGRQSLLADDPAANTDARVVDVIVDLDPDSSRIAATFTNLEVVARIDADPQP